MLKFELVQTTNIQQWICYGRKPSDFSVAKILILNRYQQGEEGQQKT